MKIEIVVEEDAIKEARQIFKKNTEFIALLNRMGREWKQDRRNKHYFCRIACTDGEWRRFRDDISRTRTAFTVEYSRNVTTLVVKHTLPRTNLTYEVFFWLWSATKV